MRHYTLSHIYSELKIFTRKQANCALFGGILLFFLVLTKYVSIPGLERYDLLFLIAVFTQIWLIASGREEKKEVFVIALFHISAMAMELFKTSPSVASWLYPEAGIFSLATVPLFTGFMYSSVGSYIARSWRINKFRFSNYPNQIVLGGIAVLIYANFFTDHYIYDYRYILFAVLVVIFWKTKLHVTLTDREYTVHPLVSNALFAGFVWLAEQIGTFARAWVYPNQAEAWRPVSFHMFTSWYMLLVFSFVLISIIYFRRNNNVQISK